MGGNLWYKVSSKIEGQAVFWLAIKQAWFYYTSTGDMDSMYSGTAKEAAATTAERAKY